MLYGCDGNWWKFRDGVPEFAGLKLSQDSAACTQYRDVHHVRLAEPDVARISVDDPGLICGGGNSGFQALNIAVQFGVRRIALVGFDMRLDLGVHWHGKHPGGLNNPRVSNLMKWRRSLDEAACDLRDLGVEVVNGSADSTLTAFPKMALPEILDVWGMN